MGPFLYIMVGFAIGYETGRRTAGKRCSWKQALAAGAIALVIAVVLGILLNKFPAFWNF